MNGILIVNRNNYSLTNDLIKDLSNQVEKNFEVLIYDNHSNQDIEKIKGFKKYKFVKNIVFNHNNFPLCHLWNKFYLETKYEYLSFLNNDIRIPNNFISDNNKIFKKNKKVGVVVHATNHPQYQEQTDLQYKTFNKKYMQGWDFTIRRSAYTLIPKQIKFFCGDDFIYSNLYNKQWELAYVLSSPIIHFCAQTDRIKGISNQDIREYTALGYKHGELKVYKNFSKIKPKIHKLKRHIALQ